MTKITFILSFLLPFVISDKVQVQQFLNGNIRFTSSIYQQFAQSSPSQNFIFSPLSLELILALVQSGAGGETGQEVRTGLNLPASQQQTEAAISKIVPGLRRGQRYTLTSASKIYVQDNFRIRDKFKRTANGLYLADVENVDFNRREDAASRMNRWVETETNQKIRNLIDPSVLNDRTRAVLINALYFQGNWSKSFNERATKLQDFFPTPDNPIPVKTMRKRDDYNFYDSRELGAKFLELPFKGGDISMVIVLPDTHEQLRQLQNRIGEVFAPHEFTLNTVRIALPKFKIETAGDYQQILKNLGVRKIFDASEADLSGIAGYKGDIAVNKVLQKTLIDVNEVGVEAAGATYVDLVIPLSGHTPASEPKDFMVDRPFIYYIKFKDLILFAGRVVTPNY